MSGRCWPASPRVPSIATWARNNLHLSVNTVRTHLQNIMAKLGVHSALEAVALTRDHTSWVPSGAC